MWHAVSFALAFLQKYHRFIKYWSILQVFKDAFVMTECDRQAATQTQCLPCRTGPCETHTETHARAHTPHVHIEWSDPLGRPGQWCLKSSVTLGSPISCNCTDRIGSEMRVGLKIDPLFFKMSQTSCSFNTRCRICCKISENSFTNLFFFVWYFTFTILRSSSRVSHFSQKTQVAMWSFFDCLVFFFLLWWTQLPPLSWQCKSQWNQ